MNFNYFNKLRCIKNILLIKVLAKVKSLVITYGKEEACLEEITVIVFLDRFGQTQARD